MKLLAPAYRQAQAGLPGKVLSFTLSPFLPAAGRDPGYLANGGTGLTGHVTVN